LEYLLLLELLLFAQLPHLHDVLLLLSVLLDQPVLLLLLDVLT
jgi:hypothetical protein